MKYSGNGEHTDIKPVPTIRDLYPTLSEKELADAEDSIERYLALVLRIFERLEAESGALQLTVNTGTLALTTREAEPLE